ncbi:MAG: HAMP domain-containing sensor histidine kinase [Candidatus Thermoplasmatota archaeon]
MSGSKPASSSREDPQGSIGRDVVSRIHKVLEAVMSNKPIEDVVRATVSTMQAAFGLRGLRFVAHTQELGAVQAAVERDGQRAPEPPHLREGDRVSPNGYFTRAEDMLRSFGGEASDPVALWREDDSLRFVIRGRSGEAVACIHASGTQSGRLPSMADVECADLLTQLIGLALHKEQERAERESKSSSIVRRSDLLEDILRIASSVVSERDLGKVSEMVLSSVSSLFGFERVTLVTYDEGAAAFKWTALFGYPEDAARKTRLRTIPTEVVLEDLRESRRIAKTVYFTPVEDLPRRNIEYFVNPAEYERAPEDPRPRSQGEFREGDTLAFALHDSTGRVVGVIYTSKPKDGKVPDRETLDMVEVFTYLAEVAIENARLAHDREQALRLSSLRMEQMSRIFEITSNVLYLRDMDELLHDVLKTLAQLLGIRRMVLGLRSEDGSVFNVRAVYGFTDERAAEIRRYSYPYESVDQIINPEKYKTSSRPVKWSKKVGSMTYYMPAESLKLETWEMVYYPDPELLRLPRRTKEHWHEIDYMDTYIRDSEGSVVAYIEILKPRDDRIPDQETIEVIEIFASLVGIALENSRMVQGHIESRRNAEFYTDLLSHDIKNFNQAIMGYLDLIKAGLTRPDQVTYIEKVNEQVMNINRLAADVRTMSRLTWGGSKLVQVDLGRTLLDAMAGVQQYYLSRNIAFHHAVEVGHHHVMADELVRELFVNILTNAVKYDPGNPVEVDVSMERVEGKIGHRLLVSIADHGRGVPDDLKEEIFERFNKAPKKKGTGLGLHIVRTLANRYHGRAWVEDRVPGDHSKGAVFKVELPSVD